MSNNSGDKGPQKKFICNNFQPTGCPYEITGAEPWVIGEAVDHVVEEHGFMDSPQLVTDIQNSLVDFP